MTTPKAKIERHYWSTARRKDCSFCEKCGAIAKRVRREWLYTERDKEPVFHARLPQCPGWRQLRRGHWYGPWRDKRKRHNGHDLRVVCVTRDGGRSGGVWRAYCDGERLGIFYSEEEARAAATKAARR